MTSIQISQIIFVIFFTLHVGNVQARLKGEGIVGGDDAKEGEYSYQVSLQIYGKSFCGGGIIDDRYVVTAAHCVVNFENVFERHFGFKVLAGTSFLYSSSPHQVMVDVEEAYVPAEYNPLNNTKRLTGDIALLKLKESLNVTGNPNLQKLKLPAENQTVDWVQATITGFGYNEIFMKFDPQSGYERENGGRSDGKMRHAKAYVTSNEFCTKYSGQLSSKHLCAVLVQRDARHHEGICGGDSGSPLVMNDTLIGIVNSNEAGCREDMHPAVYSRVSSFVSFIERIMNGTINNNDTRHFNYDELNASLNKPS